MRGKTVTKHVGSQTPLDAASLGSLDEPQPERAFGQRHFHVGLGKQPLGLKIAPVGDALIQIIMDSIRRSPHRHDSFFATLPMT